MRKRIIPGLWIDFLLDAFGWFLCAIAGAIGELLVARGWKAWKRHRKRSQKPQEPEEPPKPTRKRPRRS